MDDPTPEQVGGIFRHVLFREDGRVPAQGRVQPGRQFAVLDIKTPSPSHSHQEICRRNLIGANENAVRNAMFSGDELTSRVASRSANQLRLVAAALAGGGAAGPNRPEALRGKPTVRPALASYNARVSSSN